MRILGISAFYHDSAAALLVDGAPVAAAQEERFSRRKHDARFPEQAIRYCLAEARLDLADIDHVVFYEKPFLKFERLLETYLANAPRGFPSFRVAMPKWLRERLLQKSTLLKSLQRIAPGASKTEDRLLFADHHQSHAASAFFPSPFEEAVVLTMDGVGEWATSTVAVGRGGTLTPLKEMRWPHSLGLLYSAFTSYAGFKVNSGEYKLMGLAPYGSPRYYDRIVDNLLDLKADGSFWLDQSYFNYATGMTMTSPKFHGLFDGPPRQPAELLTQHHMDLAASVQKLTEEIMLRVTRDLAATTGIPNLCLAGGVALNCVANGKVLRDGRFKSIWIQPAAGDAGGALGAAYAAHHLHRQLPRRLPAGRDAMAGGYLGPGYSQDEIEQQLTAAGAVFEVLDEGTMLERAAAALKAGDAVGWFQGRMEFGPRALGARSILGDARNPAMQKTLNLKIKYRESFRPFAPAVLADHAAQYFTLQGDSPYMLLVADIVAERRLALSAADEQLFGIDKLNRPRSDIPAVTHVDCSARVQTVHADTNPLFHALLGRFHALTGCPVVVNTSFNVRGEPIVQSPEDAFRCFMGCEMETLIIGRCVLEKARQTAPRGSAHKDAFELD